MTPNFRRNTKFTPEAGVERLNILKLHESTTCFRRGP